MSLKLTDCTFSFYFFLGEMSLVQVSERYLVGKWRTGQLNTAGLIGEVRGINIKRVFLLRSWETFRIECYAQIFKRWWVSGAEVILETPWKTHKGVTQKYVRLVGARGWEMHLDWDWCFIDLINPEGKHKTQIPQLFSSWPNTAQQQQKCKGQTLNTRCMDVKLTHK